MNKQIELYYKNATAEVVGAADGLSLGELSGLSERIGQITAKLAAQRAAGELPYRDLPYREALRQEIKNLTAQLQGRYDNLIVLGIGGSALGNIAVQTALNSPAYNLQTQRPGPRLFVMDNVDPVQFGALLDLLEGQWDRTLVNVISKSGKTAEPAAQLLVIQQMLKEKMPNARMADHVIATTDAQKGTLRQVALKEGLTMLEVPDGVGGRFSVLSAVGLFSAAMCGIDIDQLHAGAAAMDKRLLASEYMKNPAALYAAIQYAFYQRGKPLSVMFPYSYELKDLCDWYRQLWAESLGKAKDFDGKIVNEGPTPIKALGATDQHSQVQLYREGPNDKVFTFLETQSFNRDVTIGPAGQVEELAYLAGQPMGTLLNSEKMGTEYALVQSQRPCVSVRFPQINAFTVGQFIYMFEVATSYMGELLNINTYDQPAVELGKQATFALMGHPDYRDLLEKIEKTNKIDNDFLV